MSSLRSCLEVRESSGEKAGSVSSHGRYLGGEKQQQRQQVGTRAYPETTHPSG